MNDLEKSLVEINAAIDGWESFEADEFVPQVMVDHILVELKKTKNLLISTVVALKTE